jgi:hypothetical protein
MLTWNADTAQYLHSNKKLFDIVAGLKDESTVELVKQVYPQLPADKEAMRFYLLYLVAAHKTAEKFTLMKDLFIAHPPATGDYSAELFNLLDYDSLALTASVFPDLLPLLRDSVNRYDIIQLTEKLLDSNFINSSTLLAWKKELFAIAHSSLKKLARDKEYDQWFRNHSLIRLLGKLKDPEANALLQKYILQPNLYLGYTATIALLQNNQPVPAAQFAKLAADNDYRTTLYYDLGKFKKRSLFPKQYLNQRSFAETELYDYFSEDYEVKKITYIGERTATYNGEKKKFYLFKVDLSSEEEKMIHLGIAGPYALSFKEPETSGEATGLYHEKDFNAATIDADFRAYLKKIAEEETGSER